MGVMQLVENVPNLGEGHTCSKERSGNPVRLYHVRVLELVPNEEDRHMACDNEKTISIIYTTLGLGLEQHTERECAV